MTGSMRRARVDWRAERERIDLAAVAAGLLGPAPGRAGERGRKLWWNCPFHADPNPSFCIDPGQPWYRCYGCGERGDAARLVMMMESVSFPEALARLTGGSTHSWPPSPRAVPPARPTPDPPVRPKGIPEADALALVEEAAARLWTPEGADALAHLVGRRHLDLDVIRDARLGVVEEPLDLPGLPRGIVVPCFDRNRLALLKIRQPVARKPKYREVFRDRPGLYPGRDVIRPGLPCVIVEGELDTLLLGHELAGLAAVVTLGSSSSRPTHVILGSLLPAPSWFIATDRDEAGEKAAAGWPAARSRRIRPPSPYKDWTEARQGGVNLRRWWIDRLAGDDDPTLFTWEELNRWRWGPAAGLGAEADIDQRQPSGLSPDDGPGSATPNGKCLTEIEATPIVNA